MEIYRLNKIKQNKELIFDKALFLWRDIIVGKKEITMRVGEINIFFIHTYPHGVDNLKKNRIFYAKLWITFLSKIRILLLHISTHSCTFLDNKPIK